MDIEGYYEKKFKSTCLQFTDGNLTESNILANMSVQEFHLFLESKNDYLSLHNKSNENE